MKKFLILFLFLIFCTTQIVIAEDISKYIFKPKPITKAECEQIKDKYGIGGCYVENDYLAGAVKACGGADNMPSMKDFENIFNQIMFPMLFYADSSYFTEYYFPLNNKAFYTNNVYFRQGTFFYGYNGHDGFEMNIKTDKISNENLKKYIEDYKKYLERCHGSAWKDMVINYDGNPPMEYIGRKIGKYTSNKLMYRDNKDNQAYAICKKDLLKYYGE